MNILDEAVYQMMLTESHRFWGHYLFQFERKINNKIPTLCTYPNKNNGFTIEANEECLKKENIWCRFGMIEHELLHITKQHFERFADDFKHNPQIANIGSDCAINQLIQPKNRPDWIVMPQSLRNEGIPFVENNREGEYYIDLLKKHGKKMKKEGCGYKGEKLTDLQKTILDKMVEKAYTETGHTPGGMEEDIKRVMRKNQLNWKQLLSIAVNFGVRADKERSYRRPSKRTL